MQKYLLNRFEPSAGAVYSLLGSLLISLPPGTSFEIQVHPVRGTPVYLKSDVSVCQGYMMKPNSVKNTQAMIAQTAVKNQPFVHRNLLVIDGCPVISGARELAAGVMKAKKQQ